MREEKKFKKKKVRGRKIAMLFLVIGITTVVLIVETYAWFIGIGEVSVESFEIGVSSGENLLLSLDGSTWSDTLTISEDAVTSSGPDGGSSAYVGNSNHWTGSGGLIPMSTDGAVDAAVGRLKLYGKSSLSATPGGFRLISTRIDNYSGGTELSPEKDGYVAFDLFIKNGSGTDYIEDYNEADDEDIYLTTDSAVTALSSGSPDYGIANSVRVAFVQVGRVAAQTKDTTDITSISCDTTATNTKLCEDIKTVIWEPNDTLHDSNLIDYFTRVCKQKTGPNVYTDEACDPITTGTAVPNYVVNSDILSADNVDVYDGINGYTAETESKLTKLETFTDTMKNLTDSDRPTFFKLAANSITKVRVYIYLEGQDVDNYDLISLGKKVSVQFGFTKDQLDLINQDEA